MDGKINILEDGNVEKDKELARMKEELTRWEKIEKKVEEENLGLMSELEELRARLSSDYEKIEQLRQQNLQLNEQLYGLK